MPKKEQYFKVQPETEYVIAIGSGETVTIKTGDSTVYSTSADKEIEALTALGAEQTSKPSSKKEG